MKRENNQPWCKHGGCELGRSPQLGSGTGGQLMAEGCRAWVGWAGPGAGAKEPWGCPLGAADLKPFCLRTRLPSYKLLRIPKRRRGALISINIDLIKN